MVRKHMVWRADLIGICLLSLWRLWCRHIVSYYYGLILFSFSCKYRCLLLFKKKGINCLLCLTRKAGGFSPFCVNRSHKMCKIVPWLCGLQYIWACHWFLDCVSVRNHKFWRRKIFSISCSGVWTLFKSAVEWYFWIVREELKSHW